MSKVMRVLVCWASLCVGLGSCVEAPIPGEQALTSQVTDWRDEVIYQILTDRFADGDSSNNHGVNVHDPSAYHGGDWQGIIDKLDYLQDLGVTALWISPAVKNVEADAGFSSYHGYWTQDFTRANSHFGNLAKLRELVDACHEQGIKVILDIVTNHVGQAFYYDINKNGQPDDILMGQGGGIGHPLGQDEGTSELVRITEWDPDFNMEGIQAWTSLGPSGDAPIRFAHDPATGRVAPYPSIFASKEAYNAKGRVTVWNHPQVCECSEGRCDFIGRDHCELAQLSLGASTCSCTGDSCAWRDSEACLRTQEVLGDFPGGLKDIKTTRQDVRDSLFEIFSRWIALSDVDGFRIDTLKHVEASFWEDFSPRIREYARSMGKENFFMFGEAFDGSDALLGSYTQGSGVDSVFYFSAYFELYRNQFLGNGGRTCDIERLHCRRHGCDSDPCAEGGAIESLYNGVGKAGGPRAESGELLNSRQLVVNFSSNHDVGRFLYFMPTTWSSEQKQKTLHLGLAYLLTIDGIPSLYYGVEQAFSGGNDPANRETLWDPQFYVGRSYLRQNEQVVWQAYDQGNPTYQFLKTLLQIRKDEPSLRRGDFITRWSTRDEMGGDRGLYVFERSVAAESTLVAMNLFDGSSSTTQRGSSTMVVGVPAGTRMVDALDSSYEIEVGSAGCPAVGEEGCVVISVPPRTVRIMVY